MSTTQIIIFKYCPLPFLYTPAFSRFFPRLSLSTSLPLFFLTFL